jgi:hypothetical protein
LQAFLSRDGRDARGRKNQPAIAAAGGAQLKLDKFIAVRPVPAECLAKTGEKSVRHPRA